MFVSQSSNVKATTKTSSQCLGGLLFSIAWCEADQTMCVWWKGFWHVENGKWEIWLSIKNLTSYMVNGRLLRTISGDKTLEKNSRCDMLEAKFWMNIADGIVSGGKQMWERLPIEFIQKVRKCENCEKTTFFFSLPTQTKRKGNSFFIFPFPTQNHCNQVTL